MFIEEAFQNCDCCLVLNVFNFSHRYIVMMGQIDLQPVWLYILWQNMDGVQMIQ